MTADRLDITLDAVNQELARLHLTGDVDADLTPEQKRDRLELHAAEGRVCSAKYRDQAGIGALMPDLSKLNPEEQTELLKLLEHDEVIEPPTIVFSVTHIGSNKPPRALPPSDSCQATKLCQRSTS